MNKGEVKATVTKVTEGVHGMYAVANSESVEGSITFSLEDADKVWQDNGYLEKGDVVVLSRLRRKEAGWRAYRARFYTLADEKQSEQ